MVIALAGFGEEARFGYELVATPAGRSTGSQQGMG